MTIRILLADDHRMFREALCSQLAAEPDVAIIGEANTGAEALEALQGEAPDVFVLDIGLPDMNGIELAKRVTREYPQIGIVALSGYAERMFVEEMLKAGAKAYVVKSAGMSDLLNGIRAVAKGKSFLSAEVTGLMLRRVGANENKIAPPVTVLSRREQDVLRLLADGRRAAAIAGELGISVATVEVHRRNIKDKLGLRTTADLTRYAIREGLVAP
ncbi:MAG: response regulator transcription factor [Gammaproteobacteria bacterium]|nr:response regulator transcription factor [Gammaproteobacteria bacterium]MBI5616007.1 response regulator transcription factor [Gammaproteobacteria bacterium]